MWWCLLDTNFAITTSSATSGGSIINDLGSEISLRGVCYSTNINPTVLNSVVESGSGIGSYSCDLTNFNMRMVIESVDL